MVNQVNLIGFKYPTDEEYILSRFEMYSRIFSAFRHEKRQQLLRSRRMRIAALYFLAAAFVVALSAPVSHPSFGGSAYAVSATEEGIGI